MAKRRQRRNGAPDLQVRPPGIHALVLVIAGIAIYANSLSGPFVFDDVPAIAESAAVRAWPDLPAVIAADSESPLASRPLVSLSFALNYAVHGLDVTGYHVVSVALHLACALLLFGLLRRTFERLTPSVASRAVPLAFAAALLWVVHPLNSEVVDYLTQRTESMMAAAYLLTMYAAIRALDDPRPALWQTIAVVACALGMASKESMVTAPVLVVLYDRVFVFDTLRGALRSRGRFYAALAATFVVLALSMWSSPRTMSTGFATANTSTWVYLLNQTGMIVRYLRLALWPDALVLYYGWSLPVTLGEVLPSATVVLLLLAATVAALVRRPRLGFAGAWFFLTLAPTSSFVVIASEVGAERRMYLPLMGLVALGVVAGALGWDRLRARWTGRRPPAIVGAAPTLVVVVLCVALGARTVARNREYASGLTMAETVLARWPTSAARHMVGTELLNAGRSEASLEHLRAATADLAPAHFDYGTALFNVDRLDDAIGELETFIRLEPRSPYVPRARKTIGRAFARQGRLADAVDQLEQAIAATPGDIEARGLLADAFFAQERFDRAIPLYRDVIAASPRHAGALGNLAISLMSTGQADEAVEMFRRAAEADSSNARARINLAIALVDRGELDEASTHAREAVRLSPNDLAALDVYGRILAGQGKVPEAIAQFEHALRVDPNFAPAREALRTLRGGY